MVAYTFYEEDARVRRYAEALAQRGDRVDVIALRQKDFPSYEIAGRVNVHRIQDRIRNEKNKYSYLIRLSRFLINSWIWISRQHISSKYDLVHVHSVPDFEVFAALLPKINGAKIILDIHDIVPEFYAAKFHVNQNCLAFKLLKYIEKVCVRFSDHVIISNHLWAKKLTCRSAPAVKCSTLINYPDQLFFNCAKPSKEKGKFLVLYPGSLNWHQGLDIAIRAFALFSKQMNDSEFHIYGQGPEEMHLRDLVVELGLENKVIFKGTLPLDSISKAMAEASVGVVPKRNDSFGGQAFSTKVLEFMALKVPIILSKTEIDKSYFTESLVHFFEPENVSDLAGSLMLLANDKNKRDCIVANASQFISGLSWEERKKDYLMLVDGLLCGRSAKVASPILIP